MKYFKKFLTALKKMGLDINPGVLVLVLLVVTLGVVYWRYRANKKKAEGAAPAGTPSQAPAKKAPAGPPPVPKDRFVKVWQRFLSELPPMVRRSVHQFQPMVVLGGLGSGKTGLITQHTDWQRQARFLFGSHLDDPDLQVYLGSRVLVLELPPSVLSASGRGMREALLHLFRRLFRWRTPVAVVALNPLELQQMTPDETRALADAIRGKVNLLSFVRRRPIELRLALTHLDRVEGFSDLAQVVRRHGGSLELSVPSAVGGVELEAELAEQLGDLARVRSTALKELPSERYLKGVRFLRQAPELLASVGSFAATLMAPEPLSAQPTLSAVYLTSAQLPEPASAPFRAPELTQDRLRSPLFRHRLTAGVTAALLCLGLGWAYFRERGLWTPAKDALQRYQAETGFRQRPEVEQALRTQVMNFVDRRTFPSFFEGAEQEARRTVAERLRRVFILHELQDALARPDGARRAVYLASLADLEPDSELALRLQNDDTRERWAQSTGIDASMIADYLQVVGALGPDRTPTPPLRSEAWQGADRDPASNVETLFRFTRDVLRIVEQGQVEADELTKVRRQAGLLKRMLEAVNESPDVPELFRLRAERDPDSADLRSKLAPYLVELQAPDLLGSSDRRLELMSLLELIRSTRISQPPSAPRRYLELCEWLSFTLSSSAPRVSGAGPEVEPKDVEVAVDGTLLRGADWLALTRDHTVVEAVQRYLERPSRERAVFFVPGVELTSLVMNPDTRGSFLFSGRARIPGRYTRQAFRQNVVPTLDCHTRVLPALAGIELRTAKALDTMVKRETESYMETYARASREFYRAFAIQTAGANDNLRVVLDRLLRGSSPLTRHLTQVAQNAELGSMEPSVQDRLLELSEDLEPYQALGEVVTSTASGEPAYQSYLLLLRQMREALEPLDPNLAAPAEPVEEGRETLRDRLSPAGRMALDILTCSPESKDLAVRQWLDDVSLQGDLRRPFMEPVQELYAVGKRDIEEVIQTVWRQDLKDALDPLLMRFPFNPDSGQDATPEQVNGVLHPITGSLVDLRARLIEPLFTRPPGCKPRYRAASLPQKLRPLLRRVEVLAEALWDEGGQGQPLMVSVAPVPFDSRVTDGRNREVNARQTLSFISSASSTLVNFNQRPFSVELVEPWMSVHTAQVGIKLTDLSSQDEIYPDPLVESSHWALLRLVARASTLDGRATWPIRFRTQSQGRRSTRVEVPVSFELQSDPFELFALRNYAPLHSRRTGFGGSEYEGFGGPAYLGQGDAEP